MNVPTDAMLHSRRHLARIISRFIALLLGVPSLVVATIALFQYLHYASAGPQYAAANAIVTFWVAGGMSLFFAVFWFADRWIARSVVPKGKELGCLACGFPTKGTPEPVCPECGADTSEQLRQLFRDPSVMTQGELIQLRRHTARTILRYMSIPIALTTVGFTVGFLLTLIMMADYNDFEIAPIVFMTLMTGALWIATLACTTHSRRTARMIVADDVLTPAIKTAKDSSTSDQTPHPEDTD